MWESRRLEMAPKMIPIKHEYAMNAIYESRTHKSPYAAPANTIIKILKEAPRCLASDMELTLPMIAPIAEATIKKDAFSDVIESKLILSSKAACERIVDIAQKLDDITMSPPKCRAIYFISGINTWSE